MSDIIVDTYKLDSYAQRLGRIRSKLDRLDDRLNKFYSRVGLVGILQIINTNMMSSNSLASIDKCRSYLADTALELSNAEERLLNKDPMAFNDSSIIGGMFANLVSSIDASFGPNQASPEFGDIIDFIDNLTTARGHVNHDHDILDWSSSVIATLGGKEDDKQRSWLADFINSNIESSGAVLQHESSKKGDIFGISTEGTVSGSVVLYEAGVKTKGTWKFKDKDGNWDFKSFGVTTEAKVTGTLAKGEAEGNIGLLNGKVSGQVLTGAVSGQTKVTLWDDGKLNPSLSIGGEAEISLLQGEIEGGLGNDENGVYVAADGDVLHAEVDGHLGVGYIETDKDGNPVYGFSADASAMSSLAQGKAKGGVKIFGIDIGIGVKGYFGAVGAETGCSISTNGVKGSLGGAMALGVGLDVSIDWSDAEWVGDTVDAVGDFVGDAADFVGDTANNIRNAADEAFSRVGDVGEYLFGWIA